MPPPLEHPLAYMRLGSTHALAASHLIMSRVNWTSSTLFCWAPWQQ